MSADHHSTGLDPYEQIERLQQQLQLSEMRVRRLEELMRLMLIHKYGAKSEQLNQAQLALLQVEPGVSDLEIEGESQRSPVDSPEMKPRSKHPGRQALPEHLPRVERVVECPPEQRKCATCEQEKVVIGYETSEQLDVEPAKYFVLVTKREKRACPKCTARGVVCAPLESRIIDKALASDRLIVDTIVAKYCDHLPLYRQSAMLERDSGVEISRATMTDWVMRVGELLMPVVGQMRRDLLRNRYLQADETPIEVQMHDGRGRNHQAYLWQYGRPNGEVVFDFQLGRGREGPKRFLDRFAGVLQTDGYSAYDALANPELVHAACWAHCRRAFSDAVKLSPEDKVAIAIVARIDELFAVDAQARTSGMDQQQRQQLRHEKAPAILASLKAQIETAVSQALPGTKFSQACQYTLKLWPRLLYFVEYPEVELSTNLAENSMRPIAVGRKNWIHLGSKFAGPKVAAILSVLETCRRLRIPVRDYLASVLPGLANRSVRRLQNLTPSAWASI